jgi:hypothetical protein
MAMIAMKKSSVMKQSEMCGKLEGRDICGHRNRRWGFYQIVTRFVSVPLIPIVPQFSQYGEWLRHPQFLHSSRSSASRPPADFQTVKLISTVSGAEVKNAWGLTSTRSSCAVHMLSSNTVVALQYSDKVKIGRTM